TQYGILMRDRASSWDNPPDIVSQLKATEALRTLKRESVILTRNGLLAGLAVELKRKYRCHTVILYGLAHITDN
ncbi:MAG: hypothetical protein ACRDKL_07025, partial [Solirubrobacteraceae bacterium]